MNTLTDGEKWGGLEFVGYHSRRVVEESSGITEEYTRREMLFKCSCGQEFSREVKDWRGKRALRDCGCGAGVTTRKAILSVYVPVDVLDRLDEYARVERDGNRSETVTALLSRGLREAGGGGAV